LDTLKPGFHSSGETTGQIESHARLSIGFQIEGIWIRCAQSTERIDEPGSEALALTPRHDAQDGKIPVIFDGVVKTQGCRHTIPAIHRACALVDQAPDLPTESRTREWEGAWRHDDQSADHPALVANHTCHRLTGSIEHQRAQSGPIRAQPPRRLRSMNRDIHRIVPKGQGQGFQQFEASASIRVGNRFVYHASTMLPATQQRRVPGVRAEVGVFGALP
jgi:hypothetical protein